LEKMLTAEPENACTRFSSFYRTLHGIR
jgi:hypothetical protein